MSFCFLFSPYSIHDAQFFLRLRIDNAKSICLFLSAIYGHKIELFSEELSLDVEKKTEFSNSSTLRRRDAMETNCSVTAYQSPFDVSVTKSQPDNTDSIVLPAFHILYLSEFRLRPFWNSNYDFYRILKFPPP